MHQKYRPSGIVPQLTPIIFAAQSFTMPFSSDSLKPAPEGNSTDLPVFILPQSTLMKRFFTALLLLLSFAALSILVGCSKSNPNPADPNNNGSNPGAGSGTGNPPGNPNQSFSTNNNGQFVLEGNAPIVTNVYNYATTQLEGNNQFLFAAVKTAPNSASQLFDKLFKFQNGAWEEIPGTPPDEILHMTPAYNNQMYFITEDRTVNGSWPNVSFSYQYTVSYYNGTQLISAGTLPQPSQQQITNPVLFFNGNQLWVVGKTAGQWKTWTVSSSNNILSASPQTPATNALESFSIENNKLFLVEIVSQSNFQSSFRVKSFDGNNFQDLTSVSTPISGRVGSATSVKFTGGKLYTIFIGNENPSSYTFYNWTDQKVVHQFYPGIEWIDQGSLLKYHHHLTLISNVTIPFGIFNAKGMFSHQNGTLKFLNWKFPDSYKGLTNEPFIYVRPEIATIWKNQVYLLVYRDFSRTPGKITLDLMKYVE